MLNSNQAKQVLFYSLVGLFLTTYPALAQGKEIVELDQTSKLLETIVLVSSGLIIILTLVLFVLAAKASTSISRDRSTLDPVIIISFFGILIIAGSSLIVGSLTHNLIVAITVHLGIFLGILLVRLRVTV